MDTPELLKPLFGPKKTWDYCIVYCIGRPGMAIEPTTKYHLEDDILVIMDNEAPNPFRRSPEEPETVKLNARLDVNNITSIEMLNFPKIISKDTKIIT